MSSQQNIDMMAALAFMLLVALNVMLIRTVFSDSFRLWPVPSKDSWQYRTFWPLFRGGLALTIIWSLRTVHWPQDGLDAIRFWVGIACIVIGFGITIYGYFDLGIKNTYGADDGLVTGGLYRYSRNPQCVSSILGFLGIAIAHGGRVCIVLCTLAILVYIVMPFTEEPWLEKAYGSGYVTYKARVPRFV